MTELETRLAEALRGTAERAPHADHLAAGARDRLRRRRRTTATAVAAALAVVAIPVAVGVAVDGGERPDRREPVTTEDFPDGWRAESFRDLTLRVPPGWGWGGGTDWCIDERDAGSARPQVSRPGGVVPAIACTPTYGYGAHFEEPPTGALPPGTEGTVQQYTGVRYPDGAWLGYASTGQAAVWVVTDSRRMTRQLLDSVEPIRGVDANGCGERLVTGAPSTSQRLLSVCRYDRDAWLEQSERLSLDDSEALRAAVASAPRAERAHSACPGPPRPETVITVQSGALGLYLTLGGTCPEENVITLDDGTTRQLTEDVLYWALSPGWSGAVGAGVPLPDRLRRG